MSPKHLLLCVFELLNRSIVIIFDEMLASNPTDQWISVSKWLQYVLKFAHKTMHNTYRDGNSDHRPVSSYVCLSGRSAAASKLNAHWCSQVTTFLFDDWQCRCSANNAFGRLQRTFGVLMCPRIFLDVIFESKSSSFICEINVKLEKSQVFWWNTDVQPCSPHDVLYLDK